jgi:acetylornithine deacetylase
VADQADLFAFTRRLIDCDSTTGREGELAAWLAADLAARGWTVERQEVTPGRWNLFAHRARPTVVFSTHLDTVPPFFPSREDGRFIYGRGACDAKGILAAQLFAAEALARAGVVDVALLFVVGEEAGSDGAQAADRLGASVGARYLVNGEPTENRLALGSKGSLRVTLTARGRAAHSAYPELGESAIEALLDVLVALRGARWPSHPVLGETTCNVGLIAGGVAANVVPPEARAELMVRTVADVPAVKAEIERIAAGRVAVSYGLEVDPLLLEALDGFETTVVRYTTDVPLLARWGKPLLLGPGTIHDAHSERERIAKEQLVRAVELYVQLARRLLDADRSAAPGPA